MTNAIHNAIAITDLICDFVKNNFAMVAFASVLSIPVAFACGFII